MNILVTGATGIIGGWLTKALVEQGHKVVCLIRDETPVTVFRILGLDRKVAIVRGELENRDDVARAFNEYEVEVCYHLGAQALVTVANRNPISTFEANIKGSWNVLEAARHHKLRRLVFASSDKAYGNHETLPYKEDAPLSGIHPYDVSKSCADLLAQSYIKTYGLSIGISRCGNLYGGGDFNFNRIVPGTIRSVLEGKSPLIRSDGTLIRDYLYVDDAVSAYLALGASDRVGGFNFGTETPTSVLEVVKQILDILKSPLQPTVLNEATHEIPRQWLACEKARTQLQWKHRFNLREGLTRAVAWYSTHLKEAAAQPHG